jgi:hypothetical protein
LNCGTIVKTLKFRQAQLSHKTVSADSDNSSGRKAFLTTETDEKILTCPVYKNLK